ncbi:MAG: ATP-dependent sacrificial sulfur transferase LarE [Fretibacterium sp.]|nr:ATP-dependent sacrificial sulfur transferase LarE [Fretibacterium sp.]
MSCGSVDKKKALEDVLRSLVRAAVALSGGVDSAFLAAVTRKVLRENMVAVTIDSPLTPSCERADAERLVRELDVPHVFLEMDELEDPVFAAHPIDKCFFCKRVRFALMTEWAAKEGYPWLLDGSNRDDLEDYRPGMRAIAEFDVVRSPLLEVGLTKAEVRELSREMGLFTWSKPARACLASRLTPGEPITRERLCLVEEAEAFLAERLPPDRQFRVRLHGDLARIELDDPFEFFTFFTPARAAEVARAFRALGLKHVTLDLEGYRVGGGLNPKA